MPGEDGSGKHCRRSATIGLMNADLRAESPYWPAALANMAWLSVEADPLRVACFGPGAELLAAEFSRGSSRVDVVPAGASGAAASAERWDVAVARLGDEAETIRPALRWLESADRLLLLVPRSRRVACLREFESVGFRLERRYLVAKSIERPMHFVPDGPRALEAHLQVTDRLSGTRRFARKALLSAGWRPAEFGACLLLARKTP